MRGYIGYKEFIKESETFVFVFDDPETGRKIDFSASLSTSQIKYSGGEVGDHEAILFDATKFYEKIREKESQPDSLKFLKICIFVLRETGRKFIKKPNLLEELTLLYWREYKKINDKADIAPDIALDVCERYLDTLEDDRYDDWFEREIATGSTDKPTSREEQSKEVGEELLHLLDRIKREEKTREDLKKEIKQTLDRLRGRLLAWYNITEAVKISTVLRTDKTSNPAREFITNYAVEIVGALVLLYIMSIKISVLLPLKITLLKPIFNRDLFLITLVYFLPSIATLMSLISLSKGKKRVDFQIYLPRLAAGILVGYFAVLSDEAWRGAFQVDGGVAAIGRILIPLLAVFIYILIEMNNVKGITYPLWRKAGRLFLRGGAFAVLLGVLVSDIFGSSLVKENAPACSNNCIHGLFGCVYPETVFYLAPLALFIGVFIQLLWEDKTLTAKI